MEISFKPTIPNMAEVDSGLLRAGAQKAVEDHMKKLQEDVAKYPPPGPAYARTNILFTAWHQVTEHVGDSIVVTIWNDAIDKYGKLYPRFVHGDSEGLGQRAYHAQQGWLNLYQTHKQREQELVDATQNVIVRFLKGIFKVLG